VKFHVGILRRGDQQIEGLVGGDAFAVHQNSFGYPDGVAGRERSVKLGLPSGAGQRDSGVRGEQLPDDLGVDVERVPFRGVQI
jgi:hypothetical protein